MKCLAKMESNRVTSTRGTEPWIKVKETARDTILTVPALLGTSRKCKRVPTHSEWLDCNDLHAAAALPGAKKKAK